MRNLFIIIAFALTLSFSANKSLVEFYTQNIFTINYSSKLNELNLNIPDIKAKPKLTFSKQGSLTPKKDIALYLLALSSSFILSDKSKHDRLCADGHFSSHDCLIEQSVK